MLEFWFAYKICEYLKKKSMHFISKLERMNVEDIDGLLSLLELDLNILK